MNKYLKMNTTIQIFLTDKGQYIIGYEIEEPSNVWSKFINIDNFINKFSEEICYIKCRLK